MIRSIFKLLLATLALTGLSPVLTAQTPEQKLDFTQFTLLAIQDGGRLKPIDTFAHETVLGITGRGRSDIDAFGRKWEAADFILSLMLEEKPWRDQQLVLIGYKPLIAKLDLPGGQKRFSFNQLAANQKLLDLANEARKVQAENKDALTREHKEAMAISDRLSLFVQVESGRGLTIFPPATGETWQSPADLQKETSERMGLLSELAQAYARKDSFQFSLTSANLQKALRESPQDQYPTVNALKVERFYNRLDPFDWAAVSYGVAWLLLAFSVRGARLPRVTGILVAVAGVLLHAGGIALRCIVAGRPPVTNMYESLVWVSFGVTVFGFIFFLRYRGLVYLLTALPASALTLVLLAQLPAAMPGSIEPLVPVLQSNFWLTIHVLTITLSYAAFLLAMAFGHVVLWRYATEPTAADKDKELHFWLYRVLQLGILLLAAGTILGGVWANYSWGRFWGWDPKETWALIALLCYIFVLHGRLAGWWNNFGLAFASVVCFSAVLMTWYGVNFILGKGLHSYGFGVGGESYVYTFVGLDLAFAIFAGIRHRKNLVAHVQRQPALEANA